ncbi:hypothetical protein HN873_067745 [Arachis hypogaea]
MEKTTSKFQVPSHLLPLHFIFFLDPNRNLNPFPDSDSLLNFGKLPASQANPEVVFAIRREEKEQAMKLLDNYLRICRAAKKGSEMKTLLVASGEDDDAGFVADEALGDESGANRRRGSLFKKIELNESIRYASGDPIENWLNTLLCLDVSSAIPNLSRLPLLSECDLYYVNRDTLFSYHKDSELFLQRMMALYVASHYKNSPNDLQLMADAPAHHLFVLLGIFGFLSSYFFVVFKLMSLELDI